MFAHGRTIKDSLPARKLIADHVRNLMPVFEKNMGATHKAYMTGDLPAGAMRYTLDRLNNAAEIASLEDADHRYLSTRFLPLASTLTMDLVNAGERGLLDLAKQEELRDPALTTWLAAFDALGMTARHAVFDYPQMAT